ncbi:hypothetical protein Tgr7_0309 [Thioalkalivibrio sulfidiphilus HL-EbGr7]|uniref:TFIIS-type domain-containing protein n=1 Tax=Thioalkalivibrio sulfidiphilus (strain HL-EbGR7) TaxID=396588 RepID=B8GUP6_THISH|nr:hypothetical protein [Thioalkalivibrio sulfidiphilus]ACL71407.1 hypothetical protein Tgr7_0309 [Thioalkalivibrio sulfidiphilus HL-EbGr7]
MSDITTRLMSLKDGIEELAALAARDQADAARRLVATLNASIDQAIRDATGSQDIAESKPKRMPVPRDPVEKCPRCTLRSFTFQKNTAREAEGGYEALYRCSSCGHEDWREVG